MKILDFNGIRVKWLGHDAYRFDFDDKIMYIDPYEVKESDKADLILITHGHYDHCSIPDLQKLTKKETLIVTTPDTTSKMSGKVEGGNIKLVKPGDESAIPIIEGIITDSNHREDSVNLPNNDVITNLPRDLVVECPAIINKDGVNPIKLGEYPKGLAALLRIEASVQDLVVEAILKKSKEIALQALLASPIVDSATQAENILEEMLKVQGKYFQLE